MTIKRINPGARLSSAVVHGDTVYVAGTVADDTKANAKGQTEQILAQIDALLAKAGSDKSRILWANVWVASMSDFAAMNEAWVAWIPKGQTPARATVEAKLAAPAYKVEIACVAAVATKRTSARPAKAPARRKRRR
jgi:enamine deaminase RidA (YjgF/YER057c/UK114 family)